jgi:predicted AlkP superfamily phosphohydrolase/phosphomutase
MAKLYVIGLDGVTFSVIDALNAHGYLPGFKLLEERGIQAVLESVMPPFTAPAWTTMFTGVNPGVHGVLDFNRNEKKYIENAQWHKESIVTSRDVHARTVWEILNLQGRTCGVSGVPVTYPPYKITGYMISGMLTPSLSDQWTYPLNLKSQILEEFPDFSLNFQKPAAAKELVKGLLSYTDVHFRMQQRFSQKYPCDMTIHVYRSPDILQHVSFGRLSDILKKQSKEAIAQEESFRIYFQIDDIIQTYVQMLAPDDVLVVVTDHGFRRAERGFLIHNFLKKKGYLRVNKNYYMNAILQLCKKIGLPVNVMSSTDMIDSRHTSVLLHSASSWALYDLTPAKDAFTELQKELEPYGIRIWRSEELYSGPYVETFPDYILDFNESPYFLSQAIKIHGVLTHKRPAVSHDHHKDGVCFVYSPASVVQGVTRQKFSLIDISPMLLYLAGAPVPTWMEGNVPEIIRTWRGKEVVVDEHICLTPPPREYVDNVKEGDRAIIEERLRSLGYL